MNEDNTGVLIAAGGVAAAIAAALAGYAITSHGDNPWSVEAVLNVLRIRSHIEAARKLVGGRISSVYRSERVNKIVGGAADSRHKMGLAADIVPAGNHEASALVIWGAAKAGKLGPVHKVLIEPGWVHVSWRKIGEPFAMSYAKLESGEWKTVERVA